MEWQIVVALAIAIPVIIFHAAFIWYMNIGGIVQAMRQPKAARKEETDTAKMNG